MSSYPVIVTPAPPEFEGFLYLGFKDYSEAQVMNKWIENRDADYWVEGDYYGHASDILLKSGSGIERVMTHGDILFYRDGKFEIEPSPKYVAYPEDRRLPRGLY